MQTSAVSCSSSLQFDDAPFVAMLPGIWRYVRSAFRNLRGDHREEAMQCAVVIAFLLFVRLARQGRVHLAFPTALARFAIARVRDGRHVGSPLNVQDVMSAYARQRKAITVDSIEKFDDTWRETVLEDHQTPVPDQAAFRIDFPDWLSQLNERDRCVAVALADGETTAEVARQLTITAGRVSQLRRKLESSWVSFHGEQPSNSEMPAWAAA